MRGLNGADGAGETTYLLILRYNLATFARQIYYGHGLGISAFFQCKDMSVETRSQSIYSLTTQTIEAT